MRTARTPVQDGLTGRKPARRLAARGPVPREGSSRSYAGIIRANVRLRETRRRFSVLADGPRTDGGETRPEKPKEE